MKDRVPGAPGQYSAVIPEEELQKLQTGQPFAITLTRDDKPIIPGTPYSKAAVLPDELASKICPDMDDPAPKDAFAALHENVAKLQNDYIVAQGTKDGWVFRQWASGFAECWRTLADIPSGEGIGTGVIFPFPLKKLPSVSATFDAGRVDYPISTVPVFQLWGFDPYLDPETEEETEFVGSASFSVYGFDGKTDGDTGVSRKLKMTIHVIGTWMGDIPESGGVSYNEVTTKIVDGVLVIE